MRIHAQRGGTPGNAAVPADEQTRTTGDAKTARIDAPGREVELVKERRRGERQLRVAFEDRFQQIKNLFYNSSA